MKILVIIFLIINILYANKIEIKRTYYESGELNSEVRYVNDKANGISKYFYKNGTIKREMNRVDGKINGSAIEYYNDGTIKYKLKYKNNKLDGLGRFYPKGKDFYIESIWQGYDSSDMNIVFKDKSKKDGKVIIEEDNGNIYSEINFKNNKADGLLIEYFRDNGWKEIIEYKKGQKDGLSKTYIDNILIKEIEYKNNKKDGEAKEYYKDGILKSIAYYKNDVPYKNAIEYDRDGNIKAKFIINDNNTTTKYLYNQKGKKIAQITMSIKYSQLPNYSNFLKENKKLNQTFKSYYDNGKIKEIVKFVKGKGEGIGYYRDGSIKYIMPYSDNRANGKTKFFDKNSSNLRAIINFKDNQKDGTTLIYYKDSNKSLKYKLHYKNGMLIGTKTRYLRDKRVDYTLTYRDDYIYPMDKLEYRDINISRVVYYDNNKTEYNISKNIITGYYYNGEIEYEINYKNNQKNGITNIYYGNRRFNNIRALYIYYPINKPYLYDNILRQEIEFINDKLNGTTKIYNSDGKLEYLVEYRDNLKHGTTLRYTYWDKTETEYRYDKKDGIERVYRDGRLSEETTYKNGKKDGKYRYYRDNGNLGRETTYKNGKKDGVDKLILNDGTLLFEKIYKNGKIVYDVEKIE